MLLSCFMRCASVGVLLAGTVACSTPLLSTTLSAFDGAAIPAGQPGFIEKLRLCALFPPVAWCCSRLARSDDGRPTAPNPAKERVGVFGPPPRQLYIPFRGTVFPCTSCDVMVREYWHISRPAVLHAEMRWNGNIEEVAVSSPPSLHAVTESRRVEESGTSLPSWSVMSEDDSESLDEPVVSISADESMSHRSDAITNGERGLRDGAIRCVHFWGSSMPPIYSHSLRGHE